MKNLVIIVAITILTACQSSNERSYTAMVKVSSDGKYALSSHHGKFLYLWDITNHTKELVSKDVNIFSPYFIDGTHQFMWQDLKTNSVHIQDVSLNNIYQFNPRISVYEHVITPDLKTYVAADKDLSVFEIQNKRIIKLKKGFNEYHGYGKLANLKLVKDTLLTAIACGYKGERLPISAGLETKDKWPKSRLEYSFMNCVTQYSLRKQTAVKKYTGPQGKTTGTLSPDGKYVIAGDEALKLFVWDSKSGERVQSCEQPLDPETRCYTQECRDEINKGIREGKAVPNDFYSHPYANGLQTVAVKFIDEQGDYFRFIAGVNYATLYNVNSPEVKAYMNFGKDPQPDTFSVFTAANVIDTAPKANILVMGQVPFGDYEKDEGTGIIVYHFDPKTKTLKRLWAPEGPPAH